MQTAMIEKSTRPNRRQAYQLKSATIRPLSTTSEIEQWSELVSRFHYLCSSSIPGKAIRYVVEVADERAALLSFSAAACHPAARDSYIGWETWQRCVVWVAARRAGRANQPAPREREDRREAARKRLLRDQPGSGASRSGKAARAGERPLDYRERAPLQEGRQQGEDQCWGRKLSTISNLAKVRSLVATVLGRFKQSLPCLQKMLCVKPFKAISLLVKPLEIALAGLS